MPLSLSPAQTVGSMLWLLPALAALLGILKLGSFKPATLAWVLVVAAIVSVLIGALQLFGGQASAWYFYSTTTRGSTTGFFANANHLATLLVIAIPFATALVARARRKASLQRSSGLAVILAGTFTVLVVGLIINTSIAGIALAVPVAAVSALMLFGPNRGIPKWTWLVVAACSVAAVTAAFSTPFGNNITTGEARQSPVSRYASFQNSIRAAKDYAPLGSGVGTFLEVYPSYEDPARVTRVYVNHVHNDYIELFLETGYLGLAVLLIFVFWWLSRSVAIWRSKEPDYFARAASIASGAVLAHSLVDYPLRTAAISSIFAVCCALMAEPRPRGQALASRPENRGRHLSAAEI
jgi:O-antigen ligase